MGITVNTSPQQITATVGETQIDVSVGGGVGPSGSSGTAATIAVGTVTTGAAGSSATVTNAGTSSAAVLNFSIPAGATGATGPQGPAGTTTWAGITDKPSTFTPSAHTHDASEVVFSYDGGSANVPEGSTVEYAIAAIDSVLENLTPATIGAANSIHTHSAGDVTSGTFDIARIPTGTSSTTVSLGNHTHSQLHDRSHAVTSTSDHTANNWKVFYSNGSGQVVELALGSSGQVLTANGTAAAPTFTTPSSGGSTNVWIPASAFIPRTTNGCGVDSRETSSNRTNWDELLFDAGADEFAQAAIVMPSNYNAGTITARFYWTASGATDGSDDVIWGIQARAFANDDALDTAFGTAQTVTDTVIATNDMHVSSATSAVTAGGTPAANVPLLIQIYRDADAAGDTYGHDARLLGVEIIYTAA